MFNLSLTVALIFQLTKPRTSSSPTTTRRRQPTTNLREAH